MRKFKRKAMDSVKAERLAWKNRNKKPWTAIRRRADAMRKAARTMAANGHLRHATIMLQRAAYVDMRALKLQYPQNGVSPSVEKEGQSK
jgi:hypothetical protein